MNRKTFLILLYPLLFSCQDAKEPSLSSPAYDTITIKEKKTAAYYSGSPDLPSHDMEITSSGMGKLLLGKSILTQKKKYESLKEMNVYEEGSLWPAIKVFFADQKWIIAEAVKTVETINRIRTNYSSMKTKEGYHVGMPVDSIFILQGSDSIQAHHQLNAFEFGNSNIYFKIDSDKEKKFFKRNPFDFNILKSAFIKEIFIICGDC